MRRPKTFWSHWDLKKNPFGNIETANDVFESNEMTRAMDHLAEAVEEKGIYSVTGERGIGKTTVKNEMIQYLRNDTNRFAFSFLESMDMNLVRMTTIHAALVMDLSNADPKGFAEHRARQVRQILGNLTLSGKRVVLLIDHHAVRAADPRHASGQGRGIAVKGNTLPYERTDDRRGAAVYRPQVQNRRREYGGDIRRGCAGVYSRTPAQPASHQRDMLAVHAVGT